MYAPRPVPPTARPLAPPSKTDGVARTALGLLSVELEVRLLRLGFLPRLVQHAPHELHCLVDAATVWSGLIIDDLHWLATCDGWRFHLLPTADCEHEWAEVVCNECGREWHECRVPKVVWGCGADHVCRKRKRLHDR